MRTKFHTVVWAGLLLSGISAMAAVKPHVITFGKWMPVKWLAGPAEDQALDLRIRALYVDARLKEYTTGALHEVTERLFVMQRVFRLNDSLPDEGGAPRWQWQRGGWVLVDRVTGRVAPINLAEFDPFYSSAAWYRDYVAYCGVSEEGKKLFAVVAQLGRRKPILKKLLGDVAGEDAPDSECTAPAWHKAPTRVAFTPKHAAGVTFSVRGHSVDLVNDEEEEEAGSR